MQCTITEGYFRDSHRKNAGTPIVKECYEVFDLFKLFLMIYKEFYK